MMQEQSFDLRKRMSGFYDRLYAKLYDSTPASLKSLWNSIAGSHVTYEEPGLPLNRIERYLRHFILGSIFYALFLGITAIYTSLIAMGYGIINLSLMTITSVFLIVFIGLINSALSSRFWRVQQSGKVSHVFAHGMALMIEMVFLYLPHILTTFEYTDRFVVFGIILVRFLIYVGIFGYISTRIGTGFADVGKSVTDLLPKYLGDALQKIRTWSFWKTTAWAGVSVILAILVSALIMVTAGYDPGIAFGELFNGATRQFDRVLFFATPLILTGLAVALAFKCGLFNIGAEGQVYMGSIAAAGLGAASWWLIIPPEFASLNPFPIEWISFFHIITCLGVGALCGFAWGLLPGLLKSYRGAHEVVTTMMLSYTAVIFTTYLASGPWKEPGEFQYNAQTPEIDLTAVIGNIWGSNYLNGSFIIAIVGVLFVWFILNRTVLGYEMRAVGLNEDAAEYSGINPKWRMALALAISGALAGLAGAGEILGQYERFYKEWSPGLGWDGITVAVLGYNNPWGCLLGAIFFGFLRAGGNAMHQTARVPTEMVNVIQGLVVLFVAAPRLIQWMADQGIDYAKWLRNKPKIAIPPFITMLMGILAMVLAFGLIVVAPVELMIIMGPLWIVAILSLIASLSMLGRHKHGPDLALLASVSWIGIGLVTLSDGILDYLLVFFGIGFTWILICIVALLMFQKSGIHEEVTQ